MCKVWREIFTSRSSLWASLDCHNADKTRVYLDRSKPSPIDLQIWRWDGLSPDNPFLQAIPNSIARLRSLDITTTEGGIREITTHLSHPAPLLESLKIGVECECSPHRGPVIPPNLFGGNLSSLRKLRLQCVRTELPWRNMVNLTSFTLGYTLLGDSSVGRLLDFFASAPRLRKVRLRFATPSFGTQHRRLVSMGSLKRMEFFGGGPPSLLLDHLLIPAGAKVTTEVDSQGFLHLPRSLDGVRELSGFRIRMHVAEFQPRMRFSGPKEQISIIPATPPIASDAFRVLESLAQFDPLKVERLRLAGGDLNQNDGCTVWRMLLSMKNLRTLTISRCKNLSHFMRVRDDLVCRKLEELILDPRTDGEKFDIQSVAGAMKWRAKRIKPACLKSVKIVSRDKSVQDDAWKVRAHVPHVECGPWVALASGVGDDSSDEED